MLTPDSMLKWLDHANDHGDHNLDLSQINDRSNFIGRHF